MSAGRNDAWQPLLSSRAMCAQQLDHDRVTLPLGPCKRPAPIRTGTVRIRPTLDQQQRYIALVPACLKPERR